jgi:hypothetical protein
LQRIQVRRACVLLTLCRRSSEAGRCAGHRFPVSEEKWRGRSPSCGGKCERPSPHLQELVVRPCRMRHSPLCAHVSINLVKVLPELLQPHLPHRTLMPFEESTPGLNKNISRRPLLVKLPCHQHVCGGGERKQLGGMVFWTAKQWAKYVVRWVD